MEHIEGKRVLNIVYPDSFFDNYQKAKKYWEGMRDETFKKSHIIYIVFMDLIYIIVSILALINMIFQFFIFIFDMCNFTVPYSMTKAGIFAVVGLVLLFIVYSLRKIVDKVCRKDIDALEKEARRYRWSFTSDSVRSEIFENYSFLETFMMYGVKKVSIKLDITSELFTIQVEDPDKTGSRTFKCDFTSDIVSSADFSFLDSLKLYPENNTAYSKDGV